MQAARTSSKSGSSGGPHDPLQTSGFCTDPDRPSGTTLASVPRRTRHAMSYYGSCIKGHKLSYGPDGVGTVISFWKFRPILGAMKCKSRRMVFKMILHCPLSPAELHAPSNSLMDGVGGSLKSRICSGQ